MTLLLPLLAFVCVSLLIAGTAMALAPADAASIERGLGELTDSADRPAKAASPFERALMGAVKRLGAAAPKSPSEMGKLQQPLVTAGFRSREALVVFFGIRVGVALLSFALF